MKKNILKKLAIIIATQLFVYCNLPASNFKTLMSLSGTWKFNLGDDMKWADPKFNDNDWDNLRVPGNWERQGYIGYDGFAWYRKKVRMPDTDSDKLYILCFENIDDADEVYFNGKLIGKLGNFPPSYLTAYSWDRKYIIPSSLIRKNGDNLIAVRVYDDGGDGGITGNARICFDENEDLLNLNLSGNWKFKLFSNKKWKDTDYNDSGWPEIKVPMTWESQGYFNHDGYAWYRKSFILPKDLENKKLYLVLGKIDDYDETYLNGEKIGETSMLEVDEHPFHSFFNWNNDGYNSDYWRLSRIYEIPKNLIKPGNNIIAVRVYDYTGAGGIYEGPVGIMDKSNMKQYQDRCHWDENPVQSFFDLFF